MKLMIFLNKSLIFPICGSRIPWTLNKAGSCCFLPIEVVEPPSLQSLPRQISAPNFLQDHRAHDWKFWDPTARIESKKRFTRQRSTFTWQRSIHFGCWHHVLMSLWFGLTIQEPRMPSQCIIPRVGTSFESNLEDMFWNVSLKVQMVHKFGSQWSFHNGLIGIDPWSHGIDSYKMCPSASLCLLWLTCV